MSLFYKIRNVPTSVHVGCYAIIGGISTFTLGVAINDLYCFNILNENQYKPNNLYCRYYSAKYTKSFIGSFIILGLIGGGLYGYKKKPLIEYFM